MTTVTTAHRLQGTFMGLTVQRDCDTPEEASRRIDALRELDPDLDLWVNPVHILLLSPALRREA